MKHEITIEDFSGEITLKNDAIDFKKYESGSDLIFLSFHDSSYPMVSIHINDGRAVVHYFENEDSAGYLSQNNKNKSGVTMQTFFESKSGQEISLPAQSVITFQEAVKVALEFIESPSRPNCINWLEL